MQGSWRQLEVKAGGGWAAGGANYGGLSGRGQCSLENRRPSRAIPQQRVGTDTYLQVFRMQPTERSNTMVDPFHPPIAVILFRVIDPLSSPARCRRGKRY